MRSPRFDESGPHPRKYTLACLAALVAALAAAPCPAQTPGAVPAAGSDSAVATAPDSVARGSSAGDTAARAGAARDSAARDSAARGSTAPDTAATRGDTLRRGAGDTTARPARPAAPPPPLDSALAAACQESAGDPPDLLLVTFRPATTDEERAAVAKEVGGKLVGPSEQAAPGRWYLRVPGSADGRSVADRLILLSPVLEVGTAGCPS